MRSGAVETELEQHWLSQNHHIHSEIQFTVRSAHHGVKNTTARNQSHSDRDPASRIWQMRSIRDIKLKTLQENRAYYLRWLCCFMQKHVNHWTMRNVWESNNDWKKVEPIKILHEKHHKLLRGHTSWMQMPSFTGAVSRTIFFRFPSQI